MVLDGTVPSNIISGNDARARVASVLLRAVFASRRNFTTKERVRTGRKPEGERSGGFIQKKRERERMILVSYKSDCGVSRENTPLFLLSVVFRHRTVQQKSPGHRLRHAVVHQPNRFQTHLREKNQPGTPSPKWAAPNNSSPRADTSATPYRAWNQGPRWLLRES